VKEKRPPELDDDFAAEAGGFDSLDELRADVESKLEQAEERAIEAEFREAVLDAVVAGARVEVPHELVHAKAHEMWHETARRLEREGLDAKRYLEFTGKDEEQLVHDAEPDAERAIKRESILAAVIEAERIEVSDEEMLELLGHTVERGGAQPDEKTLRRTLEKMKADGRDDVLRQDVAMRKALDLIVEQAKPIPVEQAKARDKLWTPGKEAAEQASERLWTPGS
jgi:trigger factor